MSDSSFLYHVKEIKEIRIFDEKLRLKELHEYLNNGWHIVHIAYAQDIGHYVYAVGRYD